MRVLQPKILFKPCSPSCSSSLAPTEPLFPECGVKHSKRNHQNHVCLLETEQHHNHPRDQQPAITGAHSRLQEPESQMPVLDLIQEPSELNILVFGPEELLILQVRQLMNATSQA